MTWAISDLATGRYLGESRVDARAPQLGLDRMKNGRGAKDERLNRAMQEILERDQVPAPDRVFDGPVSVAIDRLHVQYGAGSFEKLADGSYKLRLANPDEHAALRARVRAAEAGRPPRRRRRRARQRRTSRCSTTSSRAAR